MKKKSLDYCGNLVRLNDPDRFLISMFAPPHLREALWSLFSFNCEIAKTRDVVSDSNLGHIRLQWWRNEVENIYKGSFLPQNEVILRLSDAVRTFELPQEEFMSLLYAREFDLEDRPPETIEGLFNYADYTTTPLLKLAMSICGEKIQEEILRSISINYALAGILRSTPFYARAGCCYLPQNLLDQANVSPDGVLENQNREKLCNIVQKITNTRPVTRSTDNVILKASEGIGEIYFRQITHLGYDVLSPNLRREPFLKVLRVFWKTKIL